MTTSSTEIPSRHRHVSGAQFMLSLLWGAQTRLSSFRRRRRAERMLEALPYDTLKDIGFPSPDEAANIRPR